MEKGIFANMSRFSLICFFTVKCAQKHCVSKILEIARQKEPMQFRAINNQLIFKH